MRPFFCRLHFYTNSLFYAIILSHSVLILFLHLLPSILNVNRKELRIEFAYVPHYVSMSIAISRNEKKNLYEYYYNSIKIKTTYTQIAKLVEKIKQTLLVFIHYCWAQQQTVSYKYAHING